MGKAERIRRMNARERIAAQQAAARRAEARRRMFLASGSVLVVLAVVVILIVVRSATSPAGTSSTRGAAATAAETASVIKLATTVPASTLNSVGKGAAAAPIPTRGHQPALTSDGKPEVLFMGEEPCPYCGAERWALIVALSRFGTFSNLHLIRSSSEDVYSNTSTFSFYKSTYTSKYVDFNPVEMYSEKVVGDSYAPLQTPTATDLAMMGKYDVAPYTTENGAYPFVDIGNQYLITSAQYLPSLLGSTPAVDPSHFGLTWAQIAADIQDPTNTVAQGIDGAANALTAAICKLTKNAPAAVCDSAAAQAAEGSL